MWKGAFIDPPPIGEDNFFLSENVEILLNDDRELEGFYDHFTHEWTAIIDDEFVVTDSVIAWRKLKE